MCGMVSPARLATSSNTGYKGLGEGACARHVANTSAIKNNLRIMKPLVFARFKRGFLRAQIKKGKCILIPGNLGYFERFSFTGGGNFTVVEIPLPSTIV